ncbi:hypothetical protein [Glaesserella sp.]|uniref:hypothetical protein n=1 Tax=Glaesserella sp. TaxID=2094731 RepID=UPI0035A0CA35
MTPLSYQLFIFNDDFSLLSVNDEKSLSFLRSFTDFLPQRNQGIEFEVKDNKLTQKVIDSIDLRSIDNKWSIDFKPRQILLAYNHNSPDENYSLGNFRSDVLKLITKISEEISFDKSIRLGFVRNSIDENSQDFIEEKTNFPEENVSTSEIIEKTIRLALRKENLTLGEFINHVKSKTYSLDARIENANFSGIHILDDINTLTSNLNPRFGMKEIELFLREIEIILE